MATNKTTTLTFRIEPNLKEALRTTAESDHRSFANMIEVMIQKYCSRVGITIQAARSQVPCNKKNTSYGSGSKRGCQFVRSRRTVDAIK